MFRFRISSFVCFFSLYYFWCVVNMYSLYLSLSFIFLFLVYLFFQCCMLFVCRCLCLFSFGFCRDVSLYVFLSLADRTVVPPARSPIPFGWCLCVSACLSVSVPVSLFSPSVSRALCFCPSVSAPLSSRPPSPAGHLPSREVRQPELLEEAGGVQLGDRRQRLADLSSPPGGDGRRRAQRRARWRQ